MHNQLTGIDNKNLPLSKHSYILSQNYPNPFTTETSIQYSIHRRSHVTLRIYDVLGKEVATLINEEKPAGCYKANWNASGLERGIYFYRMEAGTLIDTKKMVLAK